ncbi:right-handed parallel beta-helix repeat-containing protein (plasmid) [Skermanella mucosa]|uniref:right-handed parallel beta-helix repeat-containing protein n=1 Tax=Skermanella mucosa TaxID=1789672 RepID=UPI00192AAEAA|nr:right-handed parallel beta-helix repeat-containing protein [Skermanella mucosa]UEM24597.1 right-handed parallel beta-helix repeat-containing protein [Skermanella mucosa]
MPYSATSISTAAASVVPYETAKPTAFLWVSPGGSDAGTGTASSPFRTIQAAVSKAKPGTAVMVKEGVYAENVKIGVSGTADKPIWIVSADGQGKADIKAANPGLPAIYGYGPDNIVIKGFELIGGTEGVKITQGGTSLTDFANNIVIEQNIVHGQTTDGIKTAQTVNSAVTGNTVYGIRGEEGIDDVYMRNGIIAHNKVYDVVGLSGIVAKAGSENVKILNNHLYQVPDGILVGGFAGNQGSTWPGTLRYEAKGFTVSGNKVDTASKHAVNAYGAIDSVIKGNYLASSGPGSVVNVGTDNLGYASKNVQLIDNIVSKSSWLSAKSGAVSVNTGNKVGGTFDGSKAGPDGLVMYGASTAQPAPVPPALPIDSRTFDWKAGAAATGTVTGTAAADKLTGTSGHDRIDGRSGADTMAGLAGDDHYVIGSRLDVVVEKAGEGRDTAQVYATGYTLAANVENLVISASAGSVVVDNGLDNMLTGGAGADTFTFVANHGNDLVVGFKPGMDHIKLDASVSPSDLKVAQTPAGDMVLQQGTQSITLLGVDPDTPLARLF